MFFRVATMVSLVTVCTGQSLLQFQNEPAKHAISSQSFHREDVPLSYKYSSVHIYSTPKPAETGHEPHKYYPPAKPNQHSVNYPSIQYAPLLDPQPLYTKVALSNSQRTPSYTNNLAAETTKKKDHLEPKIVSANAGTHGHQITSLDYIPGHHIQVMQSVNRIPGHNAVYRSYPENSPNDKLNKVNYLRQYLIYQNAQRQTDSAPQNVRSTVAVTTTTSTTTQAPRLSAMIPLLKPMEYVGPKPPKKYIADVITKMVEIPLPSYKTPYQKMHSLFLNVARSYNFVPAALHNGANPNILGRPQMNYPKPLIRVPETSKLGAAPPSDKKTLVFPIQKNRHFAIHS